MWVVSILLITLVLYPVAFVAYYIENVFEWKEDKATRAIVVFCTIVYPLLPILFAMTGIYKFIMTGRIT